MQKERNVEKLVDLEEIDYTEALKTKTLDRYENEIALIENESPFKNVPSEIANLEEQAQYLLYYYLTPGIKVPIIEQETKNNILLSFIMTFNNYEKILDKLFEVKEVLDYVDRDGNEYFKEVVKKADIVLYTRWNMRATRYFNDNSLSTVIKPFKQMLRGNVDKDETFKDEVYDDALYNPDDKLKMQNRRLYADISGLKNEKPNVVFNVYENGGGKEKAKSISNKLGIGKYDMSDVIDYDE